MAEAGRPGRILPALAAGLVVVLGAPGASGVADRAEDAVAAAVSRERTHRTVRDLVALGPRAGGTSSGERAAAYVRGRLRAIGLPVEEVLDPPLPAFEAISWEARLAGAGGRPLAAWPCAFSPPIAAVEAEVRLGPPPAGERGPWVLLTDAEPARAVGDAAASGAAAVLSDAPREEGRFLDWAPAGSLGSGRPAAAPAWTISLNAGKDLRARIAEGRPARVRLALDARIGSGPPRTVVATLAGTGPGWFLVCAHGDSDSGGPGADDNASGVASLLEVAAALSEAASRGLLPPERPSVLFAVWGAEIHSTRAFAERRAAELPRLRGVFNYDQTGAGTDRDALYFEGNDVPWNAEILNALMSVAASRAGRDGFPAAFTTVPALGGTDAYVFLPPAHKGTGPASARVPAATVFTAAWGTPQRVDQTPGWQSPSWPEQGTVTVDHDPYYHSSGDVPERTTDLRPDHMARCARAVALAILRLMGSGPEDRPRPPRGGS
jgi:hypothetical protein